MSTPIIIAAKEKQDLERELKALKRHLEVMKDLIQEAVEHRIGPNHIWLIRAKEILRVVE